MEVPAPNVIVFLRTSYLGAAFLILFISVVPAFRTRFLEYGARASEPGLAARTRAADKTSDSNLSKLLDLIASLKVPHSWFTSFYAVSISCSVLWASALLSSGFALSPSAKIATGNHQSMTLHQIVVAWLLLFVQGSRRLYECLTFSASSESHMWIGHWIMGILFYTGTSMAIWIEGADTLRFHQMDIHHFVFIEPSIRTFLASAIFILASGLQHDCHAYLASLKNSGLFKGGKSVTKYQIPQHPAFTLCLCPHYFAECLIYLALTIQAAPSGSFLNWTLTCALIFVIVNLGVTANGTKEWYTAKFGRTAVQGRSRMIPFIY